MFGASIVTGTMLLGLFTESTQSVEEEARQAAGAATTGLVPAVQVRSLSGERDATTLGLALLRAYVSAAPGAEGVDLRALAIEASAGGTSRVFTAEGPPAYTWRLVLDPPPAVDAAAPVVASNDLAEVTLDTAAAGLALPPRAEGALTFLSSDARPVRVPFRVPAGVGPGGVLELHRAGDAPGRAWTFHALDEP